MLVVGYAAVIIGYALLYSGASNILTDGKGWGLWHTLTGKGGNTPTIDPGTGSTGSSSGGGGSGSTSGGKSKGEFAPGTGTSASSGSGFKYGNQGNGNFGV
jgi:hypothetical protein